MFPTWADWEWLNHQGLSHLPQPGNRAGSCGMTDGAAPAQGIRHLHGEGGAWCRRCLLWSRRTSRWGLSQPLILWFWSSQQTVTIPISAGGRAQPWRLLEGIDDPSDRRASGEGCPVGPHTDNEGKAPWACESQSLLSLHWPRDGAVKYPERRQQGKDQGPSPGF